MQTAWMPSRGRWKSVGARAVVRVLLWCFQSSVPSVGCGVRSVMLCAWSSVGVWRHSSRRASSTWPQANASIGGNGWRRHRTATRRGVTGHCPERTVLSRSSRPWTRRPRPLDPTVSTLMLRVSVPCEVSRVIWQWMSTAQVTVSSAAGAQCCAASVLGSDARRMVEY